MVVLRNCSVYKEWGDKAKALVDKPQDSDEVKAIFFSYTNKDLANVAVRQAMAYAVKRDENGTVSLGESGIVVKYMSGFSDNMGLPFKQQVDGKEVDLNAVLNKTVEGADEAAQKPAVTEMAIDFNKLLSISFIRDFEALSSLPDRYGEVPPRFAGCLRLVSPSSHQTASSTLDRSSGNRPTQAGRECSLPPGQC
jgi:hypothetical protein